MRPSILILSVLISALAGCTADATLPTSAARGLLDAGDTAACVVDRHAELPAPDEVGDVGRTDVVKAAESGAGCGDVAAADDVLPGPAGGGIEPGDLDELRGFAACMRANGVPDFPEPSQDGPIGIPLEEPVGERFQQAERACR